LLEGLEVVEILKSKTINITNEERWDSEYYKKVFLENEKKVHKIDTIKLKDLSVYIKKGIFDLPPSNYQNSGIPLIRTSEIKNPTIDFTTTVFISNKVNIENENTILYPNDLVFTKIGAYIGDVALLPSDYSQYNFSQNVVGVKLKYSENDGPYILAFFLSNLGRNQIMRSIMLSGQGKLELKDIRNYEVPIASNNFKLKIKELFKIKEKCVNRSAEKYQQAETLLLKTLGLEDFQPSTDPINVKSFQESFLSTGRLDAEYYQKKYEEIESKIKMYDYTTVETEFDVLHGKYFQYIDEGEIGVIKTKQVTRGSGLNFDVDDFTSVDVLKSENLHLIQNNDIVFASMGKGSLGKASLFYDFQTDKKFTIDSTLKIFRLKPNSKIKPEVIFVWINSPLCYELILRDEIGSTGITSIYTQSINNLLLPMLDNQVQNQISSLIHENFRLKKQSEQLLETAKRAVEIAIEKDESAALQFIESGNKFN
jgi:type I restriction enzyme S subunit